ncbi:MAG TPA: DUF5591 domain-containing protein [Candidatus Thermoplasmatota archaeon]|nr:DUF5591 domain-containing protein [Candidatus Thermoplasmatota archaeon]
MLDVAFRDGRGRIAAWTPSEGKTLRSPALAWPETSFAPAPGWAEAVVTRTPKPGARRVELIAGGTWFHPENEGRPGLVVAAPRPTPTTEVQVIEVGAELAVFHDAGGWATDPKRLLPALVEARRRATPGRLLWAPGLGTPQDYALWAYLGVDLFDASPLLLAAARGTALTTDGPLPQADAERLLGDGSPWDATRLVAHNAEAARLELERVRHAIEQGQLRALVERRIYGKPASVELLRRFDREHSYLEAAAPHQRTALLPCMTVESLAMPEVEAFRRRVRESYRPPACADVLVLLPCSQRKPYKQSRSHRAFQRTLDASGIRYRLHEVMVTSPLGLVPRELEEAYPAKHYDVPVTGQWMLDEAEIVRTQLKALLAHGTYRHVIAHVGEESCSAVRDLLPPDAASTCLKHPTSPEDLERLASELHRLKAELPPLAGADRRLDDLRALASFQFGPAVAETFCDAGSPRGRWPFIRLDGPEGQRGQTTPDRGILSLTLHGAAALVRHGVGRVTLKPFQFKSTSSLFAVGVSACDPGVRPGDEVALVQEGRLVGCGVAQMAAEEMTALKRGVAVSVRHVEAGPARPTGPAPAPLSALAVKEAV